jgi:hypothetical protein
MIPPVGLMLRFSSASKRPTRSLPCAHVPLSPHAGQVSVTPRLPRSRMKVSQSNISPPFVGDEITLGGTPCANAGLAPESRRPLQRPWHGQVLAGIAKGSLLCPFSSWELVPPIHAVGRGSPGTVAPPDFAAACSTRSTVLSVSPSSRRVNTHSASNANVCSCGSKATN